MKISGNACVNAPYEAISKLLFNPSALLQLIPGCDQVEQVALDQYRANLTMHVPALAGNYEILIKIVENKAPLFCRMAGSASGPSGGVQGSGIFVLLPQGQQTRIDYDGEAQISGPLAGMHPRFTQGVANTLIQQGLAKLAELTRTQEEIKP
jgi:carbon monoxide dehydrogenase subunit G